MYILIIIIVALIIFHLIRKVKSHNNLIIKTNEDLMAKNKLEFLTRDNSRFSDEAIKRIEKAFNIHEENYKKTKLKMFNNIHDFIPISNEYRSYTKDLLNLNIDTDFDNWLNLTVDKFQGLETYLGDAWQDPFGK